MLAGFVQVPARDARTPWYLKIDTDVVATGAGEWIRPEWFQPDERGETPVFVASPWGYSTPRYVMDLLDDWADGVPALAAPDGRLPCPSQDSYLSYCAARLGCRTLRVRMSNYHWAHQRFHGIKEIVTQLGMSPAT